MKLVESGDPAIERSGITAVRDFYPLHLLCELNHTLQAQQERKKVIDIPLDGHFDEPIGSAAELVATTFDMPGINKAILKKYEIDEDSTAFDMHYDPEELQGGLFLSTLGGAATLTIASMNGGWVRGLRCTANTLVALPPGYLHYVSAPEPEHGTRGFLFLGHQCPKVFNGEVSVDEIPYH